MIEILFIWMIIVIVLESIGHDTYTFFVIDAILSNQIRFGRFSECLSGDIVIGFGACYRNVDDKNIINLMTGIKYAVKEEDCNKPFIIVRNNIVWENR